MVWDCPERQCGSVPHLKFPAEFNYGSPSKNITKNALFGDAPSDPVRGLMPHLKAAKPGVLICKKSRIFVAEPGQPV